MTLLNGLQFCFQMNETSGNRVDSVAGLQLAPTGTIGSAAGKFGNAVDIAALAALRSTTNALAYKGNGAFTLACWVRMDALPVGTDATLINRWNGGGSSRDYIFYVGRNGNAGLTVAVTGDSTRGAGTPISTIQLNQWYLMIGWFDPSVGTYGTVYFQLNGGDVYSNALQAAKEASIDNLPLSVGRINPDTGWAGSTDGRIDQACKWNRILTADERAELWSDGNGKAFPFVTGIGGEVGWWCPSLDDAGNGTTNLLDLSGVNNNRGTLTNMDAATGWVADTANAGVRALDFDAVNDHVVIGDVLDSVFVGASAKFTLSAWVYPTSTGTLSVLAKNADGNFSENQRQFSLRVINQKLSFAWFGALTGPTDFRVIESSDSLPLNQWSQIGVTFDATISNANSKAVLWINGSIASSSVVATLGSPVSIQNGTARLAIGATVGTSGSGFIQPFSGRLDDVRAFNSVLDSYKFSLLTSMRGRQLLQGGRRRRHSGSYGL